MGNFAFTSPTIYIHDNDATTYLRKVTVKTSAMELDNTTFGSAYRTRIGGLRNVSFSGNGFWDSTPDPLMFASLGVGNRVYTVCPEGAETKTAYLWQAGDFVYDLGGMVGSLLPFNVSASSSSSQGMIRGQLAAKKQNVSATGAFGSVVSLIAPSASQFLYASFHVFTAATTITVIVESAALIGFAGPVTRATIGPITVSGGTWLVRVAGPWTDAFYRVNCTVQTGTFSVAAAIAVQ